MALYERARLRFHRRYLPGNSRVGLAPPTEQPAVAHRRLRLVRRKHARQRNRADQIPGPSHPPGAPIPELVPSSLGEIMMNTLDRIVRHLRITWKNYGALPSPPFLILFINSICNMKCDHCFYWSNLNRRDDLTKDEIIALSRSLGQIENLNLSGGEPFLRKDFAEICLQFVTQNQVRQIYVPTNGWYTDKTIEQISAILKN